MGLTCFKSWKFDSVTQKGNRDVLASPGSYFFLSNSCGQGDEWLKSLNKGVWIPFTGVFGQRLEETVVYERRYGDHMVPLVVEQCADFIREHGLLEVGLFRQPGQATLVKELQEAFDAGEKPSFDSSTDVHTVASLLKLYLRELPEPLVPFSRYQQFLLCGKKIPTGREQGLLELKNLLHELPVANFNLLKYICQFLSEVQSHSSTNKMSIQNLATVFGPNILRPKAEDPESIIGGTAAVQHLMSELIGEHSMLFSREKPCKAPRTSIPAFSPTHKQGSQVEWILNNPSGHPKESQLEWNPNRQLQSVHTFMPCSRKLSLPLITEDKPSFQSHHTPHHLLLVQQLQPEVSSQPLPQSSAQEPSQTGLVPLLTTPPTASSSMTTVAEVGNEDPSQPSRWPSQGMCTWETEKVHDDSGGSSEAQDSNLSVYDNIVTELRLDECLEDGELGTGIIDFEGGTASMIDSNSSWSLCEVLLMDGGSESGGPDSPYFNQGSVCFTSSKTDEEPHPNSPTSSTAPTDAPLSTGSSEVFLPSAPSDQQDLPASQAIQCILVGLRQQMARQKVDYEDKINRLEQRNEALQGQVAGLRATLEQHRLWVSVAEIKMRNMERARADADKRNAALQHEMEQFFTTFGELNSEARKTERIIQSF
ncbi:rho GTPase-activating protein 24 [Trichomycterus rosablanca]|uniref:rho GTPase-activating protein 24 n=1 Tax=Trichomycterus rosablanca TaxID=2290929 RepID=UPI002F35F02E